MSVFGGLSPVKCKKTHSGDNVCFWWSIPSKMQENPLCPRFLELKLILMLSVEIGMPHLSKKHKHKHKHIYIYIFIFIFKSTTRLRTRLWVCAFKEHVWCQSLGFGVCACSSFTVSDCHSWSVSLSFFTLCPDVLLSINVSQKKKEKKQFVCEIRIHFADFSVVRCEWI